MKRAFVIPSVFLLLAVQSVAAVNAAEPLDLRRGVPEDVYLVVQSMHNPERDYQKKYYEEICKTIQDTKIIERALKIATSRMQEDQLAQANSVIDELREAAKPIDIEALSNCKEMIYAQQMVMWQAGQGAPSMPSSQHLALVRVTPEVAASTVEGVKNLFAIAEKYTNGELSIEESKVGDASLVTLVLPPQQPMQLTVGQIDDIFFFCTSKELLEKSLNMLTSTQGKSKFDDPRLVAALEKLPKAEDGLVFYDGRSQFATLSKIGPSLAQLGGGDPNIERVVKLLDMFMKDLSVFDYEVTVEYTEGNLNRSATLGKLMPGTEDSTLRKMLSSGEPFEKWQSWVPAGALSYSMGTGVNLHTLYERVMGVLKEDVPEAADGLAQFDQVQQQLDLFLDRDILQAFSGEYASVSVVSESGKRESVTALRCHKPDRIKELLHRGVDALNQIKQVQAQQLKLVESKDLDGFENVSATLLPFLGLSPVIGFQDGWMYLGQSADAVKKVLETKAGNGETIDNTEAFKRLAIDVEGPVQSIKYANTAEDLRAVADALGKVGFAFQMIVGMSGANADDKSLEPLKEALALLPDVARIVRKFDFLQAKITVVQDGDDADTYTKRSVVVVRPAEEDAAEESAGN